MELIYLVTDGKLLLQMDEVFKKPASQFLFTAEYLIRKRQIEYNEQKAAINKNKHSSI